MCKHPLTQPKKVFVNFNPGDGFQSGHFAGGSAGLPGHRKNVNIVRFFKASFARSILPHFRCQKLDTTVYEPGYTEWGESSVQLTSSCNNALKKM
jgi:hypothetical protein